MSKQVDGQIGTVAALVRSTFLVNAVYADSAREYGLTQQQGQLLCVLMAQPYGMSELGAVLRLAKSSLTGAWSTAVSATAWSSASRIPRIPAR
ncbi:hypothetical protein [Nonomuraea dietziae]|uniref:hypothetical protein n=1 Tax=Nonomuraea dietziae TaxID=65515 RepID=UPI0031D2444F